MLSLPGATPGDRLLSRRLAISARMLGLSGNVPRLAWECRKGESRQMPTLHRYSDRAGYYVKGISHGKSVTFELTPEGEQYLTDTLGLGDGAKFTGDTLKWLYRKKWAAPGANSPPEEPAAVAPPPLSTPAPEPAVSYE